MPPRSRLATRTRLLASALVFWSPLVVSAEWRDKVDPWVFEQLAAAPESVSSPAVEVLLFLDEQADLGDSRRVLGKAEKGRLVVLRLQAVAERTQGPLLAELERLGVPHRAYWIANMIWARGGPELVRAMAARAEVAYVLANPWVAAELPDPLAPAVPEAPNAIEWGVDRIGAPTFWAQGITGQGVVVAGQDTGYRWDHDALRSSYRGWNGVSAVHDFHWHDAIHVANASCAADSPTPCDDNNHGTHTMGTMVGDDGGANQIGVAPGARWIGCRNMNGGNGTPTTYAECFQFFLAPTDLAGANPDPELAPDVINNSWGCPPSEGCINPAALQTVVENVRAAGIVVVASAGNSGSSCSTVSDPPAIYAAAFTVGSTSSSNEIASSSSRGPVTVDGSNRLKPDVAAPGVSVRSAIRNGGYSSFSGTSMAGPHVAGQVALLLAAQPNLRGDVDRIEACIRATAVASANNQTCGGIPAGNVPNNVFGHGRAALVWPLPEICKSPLIFADGFEDGTSGAWSGSQP